MLVIKMATGYYRGDKRFSQCLLDESKDDSKSQGNDEFDPTLLNEIEKNSNQVTKALNQLLYKCKKLHLIFLPLGFKSSEKMVRKICEVKFGADVFDLIVKELYLDHCENLYDNIEVQFPKALLDFGFTKTIARRQGKIYGYFVSTTRKVQHPSGAAVSHVFTNMNTQSLMTNGRPVLRAERFKKITDILDDDDKRFSSCVTGSPSSVLCGIEQDISLPLDFGVLSDDPRVNGSTFGLRDTQVRNILEDTMCGAVNIPESSLRWEGSKTLVPPHELDLYLDRKLEQKCSKDVIFEEELIAYYKGIKFLYLPTCALGSGTKQIDSRRRKSVRVHIEDRKHITTNPRAKHNLVTTLLRDAVPSRVYERESTGPVHILKNCLLSDVQSVSTSGKGLWILREDLSFDVTIGECFLPWVLTSKFCACGGMSWNKQLIVCDHRGGHTHIQKVKRVMERQLIRGCTESYRLTGDLVDQKKSRKVVCLKNKKAKIKEEDACSKKRDSVSFLSTLLPRDERHFLEVHI